MRAIGLNIARWRAPDQLKLMKELGVTPSFFNAHVYYWGDRHRDIFLGPQRRGADQPAGHGFSGRPAFTLHNDTPVTPVDPLLARMAAVNRLTLGGKVLGPEERISVEQALRAVTLDAAWQNFEENAKGSIEVGKLADFVVLAENPLTARPERIKDIKVVETVIGGQRTWAGQ